MAVYRAAWLLPISGPPIRDAWLQTAAGRIMVLGSPRTGAHLPSNALDLGQVAILPGLVNAHTHLELSWMKGRVTNVPDFPSWIREVIRLQRLDVADPGERTAAISAAVADARATGTVLFGDISNTLETVPILRSSNKPAAVFHELIGFKGERADELFSKAAERQKAAGCPETVRCWFSAHAPYSVSPALFRLIADDAALRPNARYSVHLAESAAETEFLKTGKGPWRALLEDLGAWDAAWTTPECDAVTYLDDLGFLSERALVVHGTQLGGEHLFKLKTTGASLVTCPRGNELTRAGTPPISEFFRAGLNVAIGTDSLASVPDLNVFSELAALRRLAPEIEASKLLQAATLGGAKALGFEADFGTLDVGKRDELICVDVPPDISDVEEWLVSGIAQPQIHPLKHGGV